MAKPNFKKLHGPQLVEAGYMLVPIKAGEKQPMTREWPLIRSTPELVEKWARSSYYGGLGVLGQFAPGIDIDVRDPALVAQLVGWVQDNIGVTPVRVGNAPRVLLPCSAPEGGLGPDSSAKYKDSSGVTHQLEIKAAGQQWVAYGVHPGTGKPYIWERADGTLCQLHDFEAEWLPELTGDKIIELFSFFERAAPSQWEKISKGAQKNKAGGLDASGNLTGLAAFENYKPPLNIDTDRLRGMLKVLDPDTSHAFWLDVGMALCHQYGGDEEGYQLFVEWSEKSLQFDQAEIDRRWPTWSEKSYHGLPVTAASIVHFYNEALKEGDDPTRRLKSKKLSDWEERFALVEQPDTTEVHDAGVPIYKAPRRLLRAFREHNGGYKHTMVDHNGELKTVPMVEAWKDSLSTRHYAGYTYQPGRPRFCPRENAYGDDAQYVNTFFFPPHAEGEGDMAPFFDFMAHLFPEPVERDWVIEWLARLIQRPEVRSFVTPISITPVTGTGRGILFEILRAVVGGHNTHDVSKDDLEGRFNGFLDKCLIAVVQEIKAATGEHKYQMWERMKSLLADTTANIQAKGDNSYTATIYANFLMFSNNLDALPITDINERRIYAMRGADRPITVEEIDTIIAWKSSPENVAALYYYLAALRVDHNKFKRAPVSETKAQMVKMTTGLGGADLMAWLAEEAPRAFDYDQAIAALEAYSDDFMEAGISRQSFGRALADRGYHSTRVRLDSGERVYVYYHPRELGSKEVKQAYINATTEGNNGIKDQ